MFICHMCTIRSGHCILAIRMRFLKSKKQSRLARTYKTVDVYIQSHPLMVTLVGFCLLIIAGAVVYYLRYPFAYTSSNFYAEDGKIFMANLIEKGPLLGSIELFNGYLIIGQYFVAIGAQVINAIAGDGFETLAKAVSVSSYLFFGTVCALPWLLFRQKLGTILSLIVVGVLWATPLGAYDYAVIGTIGNLKFAFLFIAVLLVIYRNDISLCKQKWQFGLVDVALVVCFLTNIVALGLLPLLLLRYRKEIVDIIRRKVKLLETVLRFDILSLMLVVLLGIVYVLFVYINGVPEHPGYLDGPLDESSLIALLYRGSTYALFFPLNYLFNDIYVIITFIAAAAVILYSRNILTTTLTLTYAMLINVIGFVANRPGVAELFSSYNDDAWPGLFFYAGTMMFIVGAAFILNRSFNSLSLKKKLVSLASVTFLTILVLPASGVSIRDPYQNGVVRPTLASEVTRVCSIPFGADAKTTIGVYPTNEWVMSVEPDKICD